MKRKTTKLLSLFLAIVFIVTLLPSFALAEGAPPVNVAKIGTTEYETLPLAVAAVQRGETITMLRNAEGDGVIVPSGKDFTLDFGGFTYTVDANYAGSSGTETQCFQLLKDSNLVFQNGTIEAGGSGLGMVVQNYANLTLNNMKLDGTNLNGASAYYTLSNNSGTTVVNNTEIIAKAGEFAMDSCKFGSYPIPDVTVEGTSKIYGKIEMTGGNLVVKGGSFTDLVTAVKYVEDGATIGLADDVTGPGIGTFADLNTAKSFTIDFGTHTYTVSSPAVGSAGTVSQGFHIEKPTASQVDVTLKNGTISSTGDDVLMLVQNYCNMTLEGMVLDGSNLPGTGRYVLSNNCGNTTIKNTTITAKAGDIAFDSCKFKTYDIPTVTVEGSSEINGPIEVTGGNVVVKGGTFTDLVNAVKYAEDGATIKLGGDITVTAPINIDKNLTITGDAESKPTITVPNRKLFSVTGNNVKFGLSNIKMTCTGENPDATQNYFIQCRTNTVELDVSGCEFTNNYYGFAGYSIFGSITGCTFTDFYKNYIGGVANNKTLTISGNTFNALGVEASQVGSEAMRRSGSAIDIDAGSSAAIHTGNPTSGTVVITGNTFTNNGSTAGSTSGAVKAKQRGGSSDDAYQALGPYTLTLQMSDNTYTNNVRDVVLGTSNLACTYPSDFSITDDATVFDFSRANGVAEAVAKVGNTKFTTIEAAAELADVFELPGNYTVPVGKTLVIPAGKTLRIPAGVTLTNKGTITNTGAITVIGALTGNKVEGKVNGNAPVVEEPKAVDYVEAAVAITIPEGETATEEQTTLINEAVAALETAQSAPAELAKPAVLEDLAKLETLYVAANEKVTVSTPVLGEGDLTPEIAGVSVKNAALSVPRDVEVTTSATLTVKKASYSGDQQAAVAAEVTTAKVGGVVIPLEIELMVADIKTSPKAPLVITIDLPNTVTLAKAKTMVIAHIVGNDVEVIIPTVSSTDEAVKLSFVATSLSPFVLMETTEKQNPNAYTVTFTPDKTTVSAGQKVSYAVKVEQTSGSDPINYFEVILEFGEKLTNPTFTALNGSTVILKQNSADAPTEALRNKYKLQSEAAWTPTAGGQVIGTLTFDVPVAATGTTGLITANDASGIANDADDDIGTQDSAAVTYTTTSDVSIGYITITFDGRDEDVLRYAKHGDATLYSDIGLTTVAGAPTVTAHDGYRLLDTSNWYLQDADTTLASFTNGFANNMTFEPKEAIEYTITFTPAGDFQAGDGIVGGKVAAGVDANFTITAPATGVVATVKYSVGGATATELVATSANSYKIPGASIGDNVAVTVEYKLNLTAADIAIYTTETDDAFQNFSTFTGTKTLVRIKAPAGVTNLVFGEGGPTIYATTEYGEYNFIALVDFTGVTVSEAGMLTKLNALGINVSDTEVKTLNYNWNTNGKPGARVADVQATYDFWSRVSLGWAPTEEQLLIADVVTIGADAGLNRNALVSYSVARDGQVTEADINAFLYYYAQF